MMPLCIYLSVSLFLCCLSTFVYLITDESAMNEFIRKFKQTPLGTILSLIPGILFGTIISIPAFVYFMIKGDDEP